MDSTTDDDELPDRFDDRLILEIRTERDDRPEVIIHERDRDEAWIATSIDDVISLPEQR